MPNLLTDDQIDAAIRAWGDDADGGLIADLIIETNLRDAVVPGYLDWDETYTIARPDLKRLLADAESGTAHTYLSTSSFLLATIAASVRHGATEVDLSRLWNLDTHNREVLVRALANRLRVTSL